MAARSLLLNFVVVPAGGVCQGQQASFMMDVPEDATVLDVKRLIESKYGPPVPSQKHVLHGRLVENGVALRDQGIGQESSIALVLDHPATVALLRRLGVAIPAVLLGDAVDDRKEDEGVVPGGGGGGGGGAAIGGGGGGGSAGNMILTVRLLQGRSIPLRVPSDLTIAKLREVLNEKTGFPPRQQRLIYRGSGVEDEAKTVASVFALETCLHLVRRLDETSLDDVIPALLVANCAYCNGAGVEFQLRPLCRTCLTRGEHQEAVTFRGERLAPGVTTWRQVLSLEVRCFACSPDILDAPPATYEPVALGLICFGRMLRADGASGACISRSPARLPGDPLRLLAGNVTYRQHQFVYDGTGAAALLRTLNHLLGYAHAGGYE